MSTTVTGKLNKGANEKMLDSGDSMFLVSVGKKERDRQSGTDVWVNYQAALFAKQGGQADFYRNVLHQGAVISLSGTGLLPKIWGDNNDQVSLSMIDSKLEYAHNPSQVPANPPSQQFQQQAPQGYQNQPNPTYQQAQANHAQQPPQAPQAPFMDDDLDSIPF